MFLILQLSAFLDQYHMGLIKRPLSILSWLLEKTGRFINVDGRFGNVQIEFLQKLSIRMNFELTMCGDLKLSALILDRQWT